MYVTYCIMFHMLHSAESCPRLKQNEGNKLLPPPLTTGLRVAGFRAPKLGPPRSVGERVDKAVDWDCCFKLQLLLHTV